jgi:hypothetical protein
MLPDSAISINFLLPAAQSVARLSELPLSRQIATSSFSLGGLLGFGDIVISAVTIPTGEDLSSSAATRNHQV